MKKRVCIALDTSPAAEKIAAVGYQHAKALNAELVLVHVVYDVSMYSVDYDPIMGYSGFLIDSNLKSVKSLKDEAKKFLKATSVHLGDGSIKTKVMNGPVKDAILSFVKDKEVDLLVIGTHSHSMLENMFMGNIALKLVKHCPIPLLVVPIK